jgi:hypothetical protein
MADVLTSYTLEALHRAVRRLFPDGGQGAARRNAWQGMVSGAARARARREAEEAVARLNATRAVGSG